MALASVAGLLRHLGMVGPDASLPPAPPPRRSASPRSRRRGDRRHHAASPSCSTYRGGDVIARRNTLIAMDGATEIRTPHDDCLLVMPSLRPSRGHTAVRLARFA